LTTKIIKELSIQIHLNGLSFCILNRTSKKIEYLQHLPFETRLTPFEVLDRLKAELASKIIFSEDFTAIQLIHHNELATIVPEAFYSESNHADYLKFNSKILKTDFITSDSLDCKPVVSVYVPYVNINNYIFDTFGAFTYKHASTLFIDTVLKRIELTETPQIFIDITANTMLFLTIKNGEIILYNHFEFNTPQDFIYYILFTIEQLQLDTETLKIVFSGDINKDDELYNIAFKYIRHVNFNHSQALYPSTTIDDIKSHQYFILKNSF
jgi:hypothetical protein